MLGVGNDAVVENENEDDDDDDDDDCDCRSVDESYFLCCLRMVFVNIVDGSRYLPLVVRTWIMIIN